MERFDHRPREMHLGAITLALDLARACQSPSCVGVGDALQFHQAIGYFEHQRLVQFEGCVAEPTPNHHGHQDALSEVKVYPPIKLKGFADGIKACLEGRHKQLPDILIGGR